MKQAEKVLNYIKLFGFVTSYDAFRALEITRLSAVIYDLKKAGYNVVTTRRKVINSAGEKSSYSAYFLEDLKNERV